MAPSKPLQCFMGHLRSGLTVKTAGIKPKRNSTIAPQVWVVKNKEGGVVGKI